MNESPFLRNLKNKIVPLDPSYLHELEVLRAMLRQEDYQRGFRVAISNSGYKFPTKKVIVNLAPASLRF